MKINKKYFIFVLSLAMVFGLFTFLSKNITVQAQRQAPIVNYNLTGWGWSSNIGWISFSSLNRNAGKGGGAYGVALTSIGNLSGYAWSPNIGWIKFAGDASHASPTVNMTSGSVSGWVRACAGTVTGDCTGADRTDGWDGWIELAGANHTSPVTSGNGGVTFNPSTGKFNGYAWGGSVVGWLTFDSGIGGVDPVNCAPNCGGGEAIQPLTAYCSGSQTSNSSVTWEATVSGGNTPYTYTWNGNIHTSTYTKSDPTLSDGDTVRAPSLSISSADGQTKNPSCSSIIMDITENSGMKMWIKPKGVDNQTLTSIKIRTGSKATILWNGSVGSTFETCVGTLSGGPTVITTGEISTNTYITPALQKGNYTYQMTCKAPDDSDITVYNSLGIGNNFLNIVVTDSVIEEI